MTKKEKLKKYFKDLVYSLFDTKSLFEFHRYNWVTPIIVLLLTVIIMLAPSLIVYSTLSLDDITNKTLYLDNAIADTLSKGFDCAIKDNKLSCAKSYDYFDSSYTNDNDITTTYRVYVNTNVSGINFNIESYDVVSPTDNYIVFFENTFVYRYTQRDPITKTYTEYKLTSFYDNLNGLDFNQIYQTYTQISDKEQAHNYLMKQAETIIVDGYKAVASEAVLIALGTNIGSYLLFILVASLLIKGNYLFKRKLGFTLPQSIKIASVSSIQSLLIACVLALLGLDFNNALGLAIFARILYIYIRYTGSRKNTQWIDDIYQKYHDERFNI